MPDNSTQLQHFMRLKYLSVIILLMVWVIYDVYPTCKSIIEVQKKIRQDRSAVNQVSEHDIQRQLTGLKTKYTEVQEAGQKLDTILASAKSGFRASKNMPETTLEVEEMAADSGIEIISIKPLAAHDTPRYRLQPIEILFKTTYRPLLSYLQKLEQGKMFYSINKLSIDKQKESPRELDVKMVLHTVFELPALEAGALREDGP